MQCWSGRWLPKDDDLGDQFDGAAGASRSGVFGVAGEKDGVDLFSQCDA